MRSSTVAQTATTASVFGVAGITALVLLVRRHGTSWMGALIEASNWLICIYLLVLRPSSPRRRALINGLGVWSWLVRLAHGIHMTLVATDHQRLEPLYKRGAAYALIACALLFHTVATQHMAVWPRTAIACVYACVMGRLAVVVHSNIAAPAVLSPWHQTALYALCQLCVFGPYTLLAYGRAWQAKRQAVRTAGVPAYPIGPSKAAGGLAGAGRAAKVPPGAQPGMAAAAAGCDGGMSGSSKAATAAAAGPSCRTSQAQGASAAAGWGHRASAPDASSMGPSAAAPQCCPPVVPAAASRMSKGVFHRPKPSPSCTSSAEVLQAVRAARYASRLQPRHKVCLKLDTQVTCTALPPDMAQQMQQALRSIMGRSSLCVSELAVRPGCVMITMTISHTAHAAAGDAGSTPAPAFSVTGQLPPAGADDPSLASADKALAATIGQALLQRLCCPTTAATSSSSASGGLIACQRAVLQVDAQLLAATWQEEAWDLRALLTLPGPGGSPDSSSCDSMVSKADAAAAAAAMTEPWLGVVTACQQVAPAATAAGMSSAAAECRGVTTANTDVSFSVEVQLWGLGKLDVVEGWAPPPEGDHTWTPPGYAVTAAAAGRELKVLARSERGTYLLTAVPHVTKSTASAEVASVQVVVSLPASELPQHHPGGPPSPLLLLALELWEGEVLRSTTPLLAATTQQQQQQQGVAAGMHAWWWGASDAAVAAALDDLQLCTEALSAGGEAAAEAQPSHLAFTTDLGHWLAGVQRCALSSQQLCAMAACVHSPGLHAAPGLPPAELQQLGEDLVVHAGHIGLGGVQDMLRQQMRRVVQPALKQRGQQRPAWLQGLRDVVLGYHCHMCEAAYKQQLALRLGRVQVASSTGTALYVLAAALCAAAMGDPIMHIIASPVPWILLHVVGVCFRVWQPATPPQDTLRWPAAAYVWRSAARLLMELGVLPKPGISSWFCRTVRTWPLTHLMFAATEQLQANAVLPARWMLAVSGLLDMPTMYICTWAQATWEVFLITTVLAPAVMLGVRLAIDARLRHCWLRGVAMPAASASQPMPAAGSRVLGWAVPSLLARVQHDKVE